MIKQLKINHVGPAESMKLEFGKRLNLLTGDNGLGKSFILDIIWWALTRKWPAEINPRLPAGLMARPNETGKASIEFDFTAKTGTLNYVSRFDKQLQAWTGKAGRPSNPGLVLYALMDGSFAVWDPARNYWRKKGNMDVQDRPSAYVFSPREVWDGLRDEERGLLCNGLVSDWSGWQKENGATFIMLTKVLEALSPSLREQIVPGELTRISLDDPRDIPTLKMPYGQSVPVLHASAGIRRIIALAYLLVWSWEEHLKASRLLDQESADQIIFLIDEIEAHLHPKWQRRIIHALLGAINSLTLTSGITPDGRYLRKRLFPVEDIQIIAATHSPLVMASVEPSFESCTDAWFDIDFNEGDVLLRKCDFEKHGDAAHWLISDAFDLETGRSLEYELLVKEASDLIEKDSVDPSEIVAMRDKLALALNPKDDFLFRWRAICHKKGWLQ